MGKYIIIVFFILFLSIADSQQQSKPGKDEVFMLPEFCTHKLGYGTKEGEKKWAETFGDVFKHMHHYCNGVNYKFRAEKVKRDPKEYNYNLGRAVSNFQYVLGRIDNKHFYLPQILLEMGEVRQKLKQYDEAIINYKKALEIKKDFVPASIKLSRLYKKLNNKDEALVVLEEALKYNPDSKILKKKIKRLKK